MSNRSITVPLKGFGCAATEAQVVVKSLSIRDRLLRSGAVIAAGFIVAAIALPIPIVHFVLVPMGLLLGLAFGLTRLRHREVFSLAEGDCPCCGTHQRLGLAGRVFRLPRRVFCRNCQRELDLGTSEAPR
jgi:hypothetical protein